MWSLWVRWHPALRGGNALNPAGVMQVLGCHAAVSPEAAKVSCQHAANFLASSPFMPSNMVPTASCGGSLFCSSANISVPCLSQACLNNQIRPILLQASSKPVPTQSQAQTCSKPVPRVCFNGALVWHVTWQGGLMVRRPDCPALLPSASTTNFGQNQTTPWIPFCG